MMKNNMKHILILLLGIVFTLAAPQKSTLATVKMTPYLQAVTTNSVYVLVESDTTSQVKVEYGTTTAYGSTAYTASTEATTASPVTYIHNIKLTGLQPNTYYHYRVSQGSPPGADYTFWTAVNPGTSFRFAWMGDCRTGTSIHDTISLAIRNASPRFSLYGGDLCNDSSYNSFKNEFFRPNELALIANVPFFNATGNHELWGVNTKAFTQDTSSSGNQGYYSFDYGDTHILVLNFMDPSWNNIVGSSQYNFAQTDLQNTTKRWKIVICHCPAYCSGGDGSSTTLQTLTTNIFEPNHVDMVLNGHSHFYQHNLVNGIHHVIIGGGGAPLHTPTNASYTVKSLKDYCYGIIDESPTSLNLSVYNTQNTLLDTIVISGTKGDWSLEGNGKDQSPYHNDGNIISGVNFATGVVGQTAKFNGSSGYVEIPNCSSFNNMKAFTLTAWIYPTALNAYNSIISKVTPNRDFNFQLNVSGKMNVHFASGATYYNCTSDNPVPLNKWSHVSAVWTGTKWQLYYNGVLVKEADYTGVVPPWTGTYMGIGSMDQSYLFTGKIDEVKVFKYALSAAEISSLYNNPLPKGIWLFEGNANDQTGNNADGTLKNGAAFSSGGRIGQGLSLDGIDDYVDIPNNTGFNNMDSFTLSAWINPAAHKDYNSIISKVSPNRDFNFQLIADGRMNVHFANGSTYYNCTSDNPIPLNQWSHVAAVWTGTKWQLYYNGTLVKEADHTGFVPPWTGTQMEIGCMNQYSDCMFRGNIDEVKVFKGKLTADQIKAEYNNGISGHTP